MTTCAILSFRLGLTDGVSVVAANWGTALRSLGYDVVTVAGEGPVDRTVAGLAIDAPEPPSTGEVEGALADADLVVVENLLTIPLNLPASRVVGRVLRGRPALLHHHDPPWQRDRFAHVTELPADDPAWRHVAINELTRTQLAERGISATTVYNGFDTHLPDGRDRLRAELGVADHEVLAAHPVRAIPRKDVPAAVRLCEELGATYWLLGPAEEGYADELEEVLAGARCRVLRDRDRDGAGIPRGTELYAAADLVVFPSTWEGFGNPPVEAALARTPVAVGPYPVGAELRALGFGWFDCDDVDGIRRALADPDEARLDADRKLAVEHFSLDALTDRLRRVLDDAGWQP